MEEAAGILSFLEHSDLEKFINSLTKTKAILLKL